MKLKPCSFCGSDEIGREDFASGGELITLRCLNCGAIGPVAYTPGAAFAKWNRRVEIKETVNDVFPEVF